MFNFGRSMAPAATYHDDNAVDDADLEELYRFFDLSGTDFALFDLDDNFDYSEGTRYDVCVLQFTQSGRPLHWSIYLQSQDEEGGPVFDVWYFEHQGRWQRKERMAAEVTESTSVWGDTSRSSNRYYGGTILGTIQDAETFYEIIKSTRLPSYRGENCQTWVENVISGAVREGILERNAISTLQTIPRW